MPSVKIIYITSGQNIQLCPAIVALNSGKEQNKIS